MAYKDKDKQKEAQRQWVRQKRAEQGSTKQGSTEGSTKLVGHDVLNPVTKLCIKGVTEGVTNKKDDICPSAREMEGMTKGMTSEGMTVTPNVIPKSLGSKVLILAEALDASLLAEGVHLDPPKPERTAKGNTRVSKPGDADYEPICKTTRRYYGQGVTS